MVEFVPVQTVVPPEIDPPTETGETVIVPVALTEPAPPVRGMLYEKVPEAVGVPLIVMVLLAQAAVTPAGRFVAVPIPVAPVVE